MVRFAERGGVALWWEGDEGGESARRSEDCGEIEANLARLAAASSTTSMAWISLPERISSYKRDSECEAHELSSCSPC